MRGLARGTPVVAWSHSIHYLERSYPGQQPYRCPALASRYQSSDNDICVGSLYNNMHFLGEGAV